MRINHNWVGKVLILLKLSLVLALAGCLRAEATDSSFLARYDVDDVNKTITLEPLTDAENGAWAEGSISLVIRNNSDRLVVFPEDFGVQAFIYEGTTAGWSELENSVSYSPGQRALGPDDSISSSMGFVDFRPMRDAVAEHSWVRLVAQGKIVYQGNNIGAPVLAYIDVDISR